MDSKKSNKGRAAGKKAAAEPTPQQPPADWITITEAAKRLGKSEKTIQRLADRGKINSALREITGRRPLRVFNPDDVEACREEIGEAATIAAERQQHNAPAGLALATLPALEQQQENAGVLADAFLALAQRQEQLVDAVTAIAGQVQQQRPALAPGDTTPAVPIHLKLLVTVDEAVHLGFPRERLRRLIAAGTLENFGSSNRYLISTAQLRRYAEGITATAVRTA